jgi:hypothetical protein
MNTVVTTAEKAEDEVAISDGDTSAQIDGESSVEPSITTHRHIDESLATTYEQSNDDAYTDSSSSSSAKDATSIAYSSSKDRIGSMSSIALNDAINHDYDERSRDGIEANSPKQPDGIAAQQPKVREFSCFCMPQMRLFVPSR